MKPICVLGEKIRRRYGLVMTTGNGFRPRPQHSVRSLRNSLVVSFAFVAVTVALLAIDVFSRPIVGENVVVATILVVLGLALTWTQWSRFRRAKALEAAAADHPVEQDR